MTHPLAAWRIETLEAALKASRSHVTAMEQDREILETRIEALEAALRIIAGYDECFNGQSNEDIARAALAPESDK
jgi:hypothetical protein